MRRRCDSTLPSEHMSRCVTSAFDISSVNSATGLLCRTRDVRGHAERERRLAHRRARRDDHQVARLEAGGEAVDVAEARRRAGDVGAGLVEPRDRLERVLEQLLDVRELARDPLLREVEDDLLGAVDQLDRLAGPVEAEPCDVVAGPDQPAQRRHLADDPRVVGGVRRRRDERGELVDALLPRRCRSSALDPVELVDDRDRVDRLALRVERDDRPVDQPVALAVEVGRRQAGGLGDRPDRQRREHHRAED